jgi:hypothetical protein
MVTTTLALDAGTFGWVVLPVTIAIGYLVGARYEIPKIGAALGFFGWPGWIVTALAGTVIRQRRLKNSSATR